MANYWTVLSGQAEGPNIFDQVEELALVGIGGGWASTGDLTGMDFNAIRAKVAETHREQTASMTSFSAGSLDAFANRMEVGDIVLTRKPNDQLVLIGRITGEYTFNPNPDHELLTHTRSVEWLRTDITYKQYGDMFRANGKNPVWGFQTVFNLNPHAAEVDNMLVLGTGEDTPPPTGPVIIERELQVALAANIQQLERGLSIAADGIEHQVDAGRIDILATDIHGRIVVIELKAGTAEPDSVAQLLAYMGTVTNPQNRPIRGILVAHDFAPRVRHAIRAIPNVTLRSYAFSIAFSDVEQEESDG